MKREWGGPRKGTRLTQCQGGKGFVKMSCVWKEAPGKKKEKGKMTIFPAYSMENPEDGINTPEIFSLGLTKVESPLR